VTAPPFEPLGLDHLLLHVRGMDAAERFYCGVLGCSVKSRMPQWGMLELSAGVTLVDTADANGAWALEGASPGHNLDHFAIATGSWDETATRDWLASHGVAIEEERAEEDSLSLYVRDPSGNLVELIRKANWPPAT
jgi:glyoxylase I family protein